MTAQSNTDLANLAPNGYRVVLCDVYEDGSSISLQLDCNGHRVCGNYVAGKWSFHVPQNKLRTNRMSGHQRNAIQTFSKAVHEAVGKSWHAKHEALYSEIAHSSMK